MTATRVLVIDDSKLMRQMLTEILNSDSSINVVGAAADPYEARDLIKELKPEVLTLDVEMPKMDGITFLRNLMRLHPIPTIMVSTLTAKSSDTTFEALNIGATDFITKPKTQTPDQIAQYAEELIDKVKAASCANLDHFSKAAEREFSESKLDKNLSPYRVVAIGSSTGGLEAIREVLEEYPKQGPGIVIAQHIPPGFSASFARRLNSNSHLEIQEASHNSQILPGYVYIAPGDQHLMVKRVGDTYVCKLDDGGRVNNHRPSVEVLLDSVAEEVGNRAIGVMLTGMGADGAEAMKRLRRAGGYTIAQDEKTSVVWGMPGACVRNSAACEVLALHDIVPRLNKIFDNKVRPIDLAAGGL